MKWTVELSEFDIQYRPRPSIKAQVLADFMIECTISDELAKQEEVELHIQIDTGLLGINTNYWVMYVDNSSHSVGSEYEALAVGLRIAKELEV